MISVFKSVRRGGKKEDLNQRLNAYLAAFRYFKANSKNISGSISTTLKDYLMHIQDIHGIGLTSELSLAAFIAL